MSETPLPDNTAQCNESNRPACENIITKTLSAFIIRQRRQVFSHGSEHFLKELQCPPPVACPAHPRAAGIAGLGQTMNRPIDGAGGCPTRAPRSATSAFVRPRHRPTDLLPDDRPVRIAKLTLCGQMTEQIGSHRGSWLVRRTTYPSSATSSRRFLPRTRVLPINKTNSAANGPLHI